MSPSSQNENSGNSNSQSTAGYVLILLGCIALCCVLAIILVPGFRWALFAIICGCAFAAVAVYRGALPSNSGRSKSLGHIDLAGQDAQIGHAIAEAIQHPAYILDQHANVRYSNKSAASTFGIIREGEWLFIKFRQPELRRSIEQGLNSLQPVQTDFNETVPADRWFSVEISPIPIPLQQGNGRQQNRLFLLSFHDLTEVKRIDKMRSDFIANASHELRTPLASLLGYIETIKGPARQDTDAIDRFTDVMLDQARRMTRLVNDLLSLSRIEMQAHVRPSDAVNLTEIVHSVVVSLESVASQLEVEIEFEPGSKVHVTGDRDELLQVFENLIENACKYGQEGKRVVVDIQTRESESGEEAVVTVQDFGPGISLEHQHRITERFYRVDVARSREKQGTGLGLAIVKHILNRHGTRLQVTSKPGQGATFSVTLPVSSSGKSEKS